MTLGDRMDLDNAKAREEERWSLLVSMAQNGEITLENAAKRLNISVEEFRKQMDLHQ